jgi:hypothetical protein
MTLIERLEAATGPDRELDLDLALAVGLLTSPLERGCWVDPGECIDGGKEADGTTFVALAYTASIDAALALVPEGAIWMVSTEEPGPYAAIEGGYCAYMAPTPALAICIAALKARGVQ